MKPTRLAGAALAFALLSSPAFAHAEKADALVAVDRNRTGIVADIVAGFRAELAVAFPATLDEESSRLRAQLAALRADRLLAASLSTSYGMLRTVLREAQMDEARSRLARREKAMGDAASDLLYTPLSPCRLVDTRGFGAPIQGGAFFPNARRAIAPEGQCGVPATGVASLMISFTTQNLTPSSGGYLAILAPAAPVTASVDVFNLGAEWSASNTVVATGTAGQFDVLVAAATAHVIVDVLGYFAPSPPMPAPAAAVTAATVPGLTPSVGSSVQFARADHSHGTPPAPVPAEARWTVSWRLSSGLVHAIVVRDNGSIRNQTDPTTVLTKVDTGRYCIQAAGATESVVASIQSAAPGTTIQASMGQGTFCNTPAPNANITVQVFGP